MSLPTLAAGVFLTTLIEVLHRRVAEPDYEQLVHDIKGMLLPILRPMINTLIK